MPQDDVGLTKCVIYCKKCSCLRGWPKDLRMSFPVDRCQEGGVGAAFQGNIHVVQRFSEHRLKKLYAEVHSQS